MTFQVRSLQHFQCLEADSKPTDGVDVGADLLEVDTGVRFVFTGSVWLEILPAARMIIDPVTSKPVNVEQNGGLAVNIQDQHSRSFDLFFTQDVGSSTTLAVDTVVDSYSVSCTTGHGFVTGDRFRMYDTALESGFTAEVVSIDGDNTVNMDRSVPLVFPAATTIVQEISKEMAVNGAVTRQIFRVGGSPLTAELDIVRIMFQMTTSSAVVWGGFGDLGALTRGVLFKQISTNGGDVSHWNIKSTSEMAHLMHDLSVYVSGVSPQGVNGVSGRLTYGSPGKHGVTLRIGANESLQIIIQDDLSGLTSFQIMAQGHIVTD